MRLLVDTHAFLWFVGGDANLSTVADAAIGDPSNEIYISIASAWEIAIKSSITKIELTEPVDIYFDRYVTQYNFSWLTIDRTHVHEVELLALHHRDPFDRMLIAQAEVENLSVVSIDAAFDAYGIKRIW